MSRKIAVLVLILMVGFVLTACGGGQDAGDGEIPSNPGDPYPAPDQGQTSSEEQVVVDPESPVSAENPYPEPEPLEPAPIEPGLVVVPSDHEYAPAPGDDDLVRGNVYLDSGEVLLLESYPVQVRLVLKGNLPTPCHQPRAIITPPNDQNQIHLETYSLSDPDVICTQVLEPIEADIPLGSYTEGAFTVFVNEQQIAEFSLP